MERNVQNGLLLKGFRKQNLLSLKQVADMLGKSSRTIAYWESGRTIPDKEIEKINKLCCLQLKVDNSVSVEEGKPELLYRLDEITSQVESTLENLEHLKTELYYVTQTVKLLREENV